MLYKINVDKKQEIIKWIYKQTLKNQLPIYVASFSKKFIFDKNGKLTGIYIYYEEGA